MVTMIWPEAEAAAAAASLIRFGVLIHVENVGGPTLAGWRPDTRGLQIQIASVSTCISENNNNGSLVCSQSQDLWASFSLSGWQHEKSNQVGWLKIQKNIQADLFLACIIHHYCYRFDLLCSAI